ncbi:hypothetical protein KF840_16455 [bacterium]|nr:hypothetical protein [bacterium]
MEQHNAVGVDDWCAMLREVGLSEADMKRWHAIFEARHPDGHQHFLEWLGLAPENIQRVRRDSRGGAGA